MMLERMTEEPRSPRHNSPRRIHLDAFTERDKLVERCHALRADRDRYREGYDRRGRQLAEANLRIAQLEGDLLAGRL